VTSPPEYFEGIREAASEMWGQLAANPVLAAPWHQLFRQVQSPRHVVSELLQNADDAGATEVRVAIEDGAFIFEHNGEDFTEEQFESLCRFGYSNKRTLRTIGFRGVGFKSTFSLGEPVYLTSRTLAVHFAAARFTEPCWTIGDEPTRDGLTRVQVNIQDENRLGQLNANFGEWVQNPISLLFFRSIRRIEIGQQAIHWHHVDAGPVANSEWMALDDRSGERFLVVRSELERFPEAAEEEIRQERMVGVDQDVELPPSIVELVVGAEGRLYVVLPTGVGTKLPFACNAPFIQDPARFEIKPPEISPTNRWLLDRIGRLAASTSLAWLTSERMSPAERAEAYRLMPDVDREDTTLAGQCSAAVEVAFEKALDDAPFVLAENGELVGADEAVIVQRELQRVWPDQSVGSLLDDSKRPAVHSDVSEGARRKLVNWKYAPEIDIDLAMGILRRRRLPAPPWPRLLELWTYLAPHITGYRRFVEAERLAILPVQGQEELYPASSVVRLGESRLLQSDDDWQFLSGRLLVLNPNWPRFLAEQRRSSASAMDSETGAGVEGALAIFRRIGLDEASNASKVLEQVAASLFRQQEVSLEDCVRMAQIAAKLEVVGGSSFQFVTRDLVRRAPSEGEPILFDADGSLEELIVPDDVESLLLHSAYTDSFESCTRDEWDRWIRSGRSGLRTFPPLGRSTAWLRSRDKLAQEAQKRGHEDGLTFHYKYDDFIVEDQDLDERYWEHWRRLSGDDERIWVKVLAGILSQRWARFDGTEGAHLYHVSTSGTKRAMTPAPLIAAWVLRLRELPCIPDTRGVPHMPADLLRRTQATESLLDVEPFVHASIDTERARRLLDALGVRSVPTGPEHLLERIEALARAGQPPILELEKWYRRLDQLYDNCSTEDALNIVRRFRDERLILAHDGSWVTSASVFLAADDDDVPDAATVRASVADLSLWRKIGVPDRPTVELAIEWLAQIESGTELVGKDLQRVRSLLARHPTRIREDCGSWLNLANEWVPTATLRYSLSMQSLVPWSHLHQWVKRQTADFQRLASDVVGNPAFSSLSPLARHLEDRLQTGIRGTGNPSSRDWLTEFGTQMQRVVVDTEDEKKRVRAEAERLARTLWVQAPGLRSEPYIDGKPAGTARQADALWIEDTMYVDDVPTAKLARRVPEEIARVFGRPDIKAALDYSFGRSAGDVCEYLEENFNLEALATAISLTPDASDLSGLAQLTTSAADDRSNGSRASDDLKAATREALASAREELGVEEASPLLDAADRDDADAEEADDAAEPKMRRPRADKPTVVERFAAGQGFRDAGPNRFLAPDGTVLERERGDVLPWKLRKQSGAVVRHLWANDACLEREPIEIPHEVWAALEQHPDEYGLLLSDPSGNPLIVSGEQLMRMRDEGIVTLYPASYRLVHRDVG
jgi:hypothetical protein